jgi:phosphoglycolate phosphatase-like HAD superfamily hydrolase
LSTKRNLGLLLARLNGWNKIVFVDDDITLTDAAAFERLTRRLERADIAGMVCRDFPDNSVVCHARRLAGFPQDNFVSGSVLGVNCADLPFPFFPDIYNEDWFFFSKAVAGYELANVGNATQRPYKPFADPERARHEEFGDLLAEGLFSLIGEIWDRPADEDDAEPIDFRKLFELADVEFWAEFIRARRATLRETRKRLELLHTPEARQALRSLTAAEQQLGVITPELCASFLSDWQEDLRDWEVAVESTNSVSSTWEAMNELGLRKWRLAESGDTQVAKPQRGAARRSYAAAERRAQALNYALRS